MRKRSQARIELSVDEGFGAATNRYRSPMDRCPLRSKQFFSLPLTSSA